jgi:hypothetical protein
MQPFSCQHREQHISKRNYGIAVVEIHTSSLELQSWPLGFIISFFVKYIFGIEVWLIPFGSCNPNLN